MNALPMGIYLENNHRFEFDFARYLLKIKTYKNDLIADTVTSPFRFIKNKNKLYLLIHNYDCTGDRKIMVESIDTNALVINHDNTSYKLNKVS